MLVCIVGHLEGLVSIVRIMLLVFLEWCKGF